MTFISNVPRIFFKFFLTVLQESDVSYGVVRYNCVSDEFVLISFY